MRGGRRKASGRIAWLAVAAILAQALVFAWHSHNDALLAAGFSPATLTGATAKGSDHTGGKPTPAPTKPDADCSICFALHLGSASAPPEASALAQPEPLALDFGPASEPLGLPATPHYHFRTRAPPTASFG